MNRREALQKLGVFALLANPMSLAFGQAPESFQVLQSEVPVNTAGKIEVLEFFHYGCSHCHEFEPLVAQWAERLPDDVVFTRVPVIWGKQLEGVARLYYTLLVTKRLDLHETIFTAVQEKRMQLDNLDVVREWAKANKLDVPSFMGTYESFGVNTLVKRAQQLIKNYKIDSVPTLAVGGRFMTSASMAGSHEAVLKVVDSLIERVRKGA
ncbi:MAG: thiol:disulfide interchange protein DsbA/DsbL [Betaproteobacteria bacterium]|nr:thiol:disulfide interchange protein DsbA/DsbL [Betaproteobacteria bacterium]